MTVLTVYIFLYGRVYLVNKFFSVLFLFFEFLKLLCHEIFRVKEKLDGQLIYFEGCIWKYKKFGSVHKKPSLWRAFMSKFLENFGCIAPMGCSCSHGSLSGDPEVIRYFLSNKSHHTGKKHISIWVEMHVFGVRMIVLAQV